MSEIKSRVAGVQGRSRPTLGIEEPASQGALQQIEAHQRHIVSAAALLAIAGPVGLDLPDPLYDHLVVGTVRSAMEWQTRPQGGTFGCREQLAVAAEVMNAEPVGSQ